MSTDQANADLAFFDVDTQYDFMDPDGALYVPHARTVAPHIVRLNKLAAERGIRLFGSVDAHVPDDPEFEDFPPHCVLGTHGQRKIQGTLLDDVVMVAMEPQLDAEEIERVLEHPQVVFQKQSYDVFDNPNTAPVLAASGVRRLVVYGVATDYCVRSNVLGLCQRGYEVTVVEDAIKGIKQESTQTAIDEMQAAGAQFRRTEAVIEPS
jgi:nicotinamidase/pyrazinamidase